MQHIQVISSSPIRLLALELSGPIRAKEIPYLLDYPTLEATSNDQDLCIYQNVYFPCHSYTSKPE